MNKKNKNFHMQCFDTLNLNGLADCIIAPKAKRRWESTWKMSEYTFLTRYDEEWRKVTRYDEIWGNRTKSMRPAKVIEAHLNTPVLQSLSSLAEIGVLQPLPTAENPKRNSEDAHSQSLTKHDQSWRDVTRRDESVQKLIIDHRSGRKNFLHFASLNRST